MSTASSIGREERKPLLDAYLFERRILFGSTILVGVALIFWIVAISTDHWYMISVKDGSYVAGERRYFMYSNAGLWRICRYSSVPIPLPNATVGRNFTYFQKRTVQEIKSKIRTEKYINEFINNNLDKEHNPDKIHNFDEDNAKRKLFAYWILDNKDEFDRLRKSFEPLYKNTRPIQINGTKEIETIPLERVRLLTENQVVDLVVNNTQYHVVMPNVLKNILFNEWEKKQDILWVLGAYAKDLGISPRILNKDKQNLILKPPGPPPELKKAQGIANGYEYKLEKKCRYIDMFPSDAEMENDLSVDEQVLDYIRSQASFACITVLIMCMGCVFSGYTFLNPRYMFKRLAGGIHFISAATSLVVIQVLIASVDYRENHLQYAYPKGAERTYGYGVYIAWFVFVSNLFAGIMFMWYSKKKKGNKAPTDEIAMADEAINIGR